MGEQMWVGVWLQFKHKKVSGVINSWSDKPLSHDLLTWGTINFNESVDRSIDMFWDTNYELLTSYNITKDELLKTIVLKDWFCMVASNGGLDKYNDKIQVMKDLWNKNKKFVL